MSKPKIVILVILALCMAACGQKKLPLLPLKMWVDVRPALSANNGEAFWMVIKEVDDNQFANDSYEAIESAALANEWGTDVLMVCAVVPGRERRITITKPTYRHLGFYFLFTYPQEYWKVLQHQPVSGKTVVHVEDYRAWVEPLKSTW